jgi:hypothetical protein
VKDVGFIPGFTVQYALVAPICSGETTLPTSARRVPVGFFTGRVSYLRYRVDGRAPKGFGPEHLEKLSAHAIGKQQAADKDGTEVGWIAADDILDVDFELEKNIVDDTLGDFLRRPSATA